VTPDRSQAADDDHQVVPFRARRRVDRQPARAPGPPDSPVDDLTKYEEEDFDDNYRHRMMVNLAALAFTVVLAVLGAWLVIQLADLRKKQDCVLSGRRNCAPIDVKAGDR
jgi:hypothetical protein